jgi:predicted NAD/FAD-dependent oxidoreductase
MSALGAARDLRARGREVILFEKNRRVGGRVSTFSQDGFIWDTGATSIAPRTRSIRQVMLEELDTADLVKVEKPIYVHKALRVLPGDRSRQHERYTYRTGLATLPRLLAEGLDIRLDTQVESIQQRGEGNYWLETSRGEEGPFEYVILTPPIPRTALLLWSLGESRPLAGVFYRSCINVALGFDHPLPETPYHALLDPEQRHPLTWLSLESAKSPGRAPEGGSALCAQMSPQYSLDQYAKPDQSLVDTVLFFLQKLYGAAFATPVSVTVKRWKYSQPESTVSLEDANPEGSRVLIASDALLGGHTEDAFEVGLRIAKLIP